MLVPRNSNVDLITPANTPRLLHAGEEWLGSDYPHVLVQDSSLRLMGSLTKGVSIDPDFGVTLQGPVSIPESPDHIQISTYWAMNPMLLASIGSSACMPIPPLVPNTQAVLDGSSDMGGLF